jgi:hypothetical protein
VTWTRGAQNPVLYPGRETVPQTAWDADHVADPIVLLDPERRMYHMWYAGAASGLWQIGHATRPSAQFIFLPFVTRN